MAHLDFKLKHMLRKLALPEESIHVLLQFNEDITALEKLGIQITSRAGDVAAGFIPHRLFEQIVEHPNITRIESSRSLKDGLDMSLIAINLLASSTSARLIPSSGRAAIIGIIDSGFDLTHPCFCNKDGSTRILAAWDQVNLDKNQGAPPKKFGYGVEYTQGMINQLISEQKTVVVKNSPKRSGEHGTAVAGIAAGNGTPDGVFTGVAPEANLIFVVYRNDVSIGGSSFVLDALTYILDTAHKKKQPVVINLSQGDTLGAHDGTSLLERAIDNVVDQEGVAVVCSAGNERGGRQHTQGLLTPQRSASVFFNLNFDDEHPVDGDTIELWYPRKDRLSVALKAPDGVPSKLIKPDTTEIVPLPGGVEALIQSETGDPGNGDNYIRIVLEKGAGWTVGPWELTLVGDEVKQGDFHVWADRPNDIGVISFLHATDTCTITMPGNARRVITVSGFISRSAEGQDEGKALGDLEPLASLGPTRDGRIKPDITAPGSLIKTTGTHSVGGENPSNYKFQRGTSMAAPHVSGIIALLLSLNPNLSADHIRAALSGTASTDPFTSITPNISWGQGKVNAKAAYEALFISTGNGGKTMPDPEFIELQFSVEESDPLTIRFGVEDGIVTSITRIIDEEEIPERIIFRPQDVAEGGDECFDCDPSCHKVLC
jgi:subtilisin family serine protease